MTSHQQSTRLRVTQALATTFVLTLIPSAAYAVNISSNQGAGQQTVTGHYADGWFASGNLSSTHGNPVYFRGDVIYDGVPDPSCGRYTSDTRSLVAVARSGDCDGGPGIGSSDGAKSQVCRNINNFPDTCGYNTTLLTW